MKEMIAVERRENVAHVVLDRADKLNAMNLSMWRFLAEEITRLGQDESLRCIVIRSASPKVFGAGADIEEFPTLRSNTVQAQAYAEVSNAALLALRHSVHPTVAMISGICVGGGLELATMCDLRICSDDSRFGIPVGKLGLTMNHCEMKGLVDIVGRSIALEMLLEGRIFGAREAHDKRLVNRVVPLAELEGEVAATVERIAQGAPLVARWHKRFADQLCFGPSLGERDLAEGFACFDTADYRAGFAAFLAKAKPAFEGR